ncbi:FAD-dependent oxidoreductase [Pusillimonas sp. ANT_WB101]|uniref:FAD-dependent oxidoreductase n=1 Tax=Pusillimonas sp. ANT_WB101 TaxID=2597356 RepID=UPI00165E9FD9|nr:FAD-dependent oxidoreductase [Pusillimonas sp. ANT_WB101]
MQKDSWQRSDRPVVVVGAGIVGLTTAEALVALGHKVIVVEQRGAAAQGASKANGGQLCSAFCLPFNAPGFWTRLVNISRTPKGVGFNWSTATSQLDWGVAFFNQSSNAKYIDNATQLLSLGRLAERKFEALLARYQLDFCYEKNCGKLYLYKEMDALRSWAQLLSVRENLGFHISVLNKSECIDIEPVLTHSSCEFAGGIFVKESSMGDCEMFTQVLADKLQEKGVNFVYNYDVKRLLFEDGRACGVESGQSSKIVGAAVVLAAGLEARSLLPETIRKRYPIAPFKGYSVSIPVRNKQLPTGTVTDGSRAVAVSVLGDTIRISGGVFLDASPEVDNHQIRRIIDTARRWFPAIGEHDLSIIKPWAGHRPTTPTGVPYVGATSEAGLFVNFGHGSFGWTLSPATASIVSEQLDDYLKL